MAWNVDLFLRLKNTDFHNKPVSVVYIALGICQA